jgi:MoaA/NifB/PqqE/SkfB family radical SAM enzyme
MMSRRGSTVLTPRRTGADHLYVWLDEAKAACGMACRFCPASLRTERPGRAIRPDHVRAVVDAWIALLDAERPASVDLASDDPLEFTGILDLLAEARQRGIRLRLLTPGLRLADRRFAERVARQGARVWLSLLSLRPERYAAITGRPDAHALVTRAIANVRELGIPLDLATVIVDENADEVAELARAAVALGAEGFTVQVFHPDAVTAPPSYFRQYPRHEDVVAGLAALAPGDAPPLQVGNLPRCRLDPDVVTRLRLRLLDSANHVAHRAWAACDVCPARERCAGVHPAYVERYAPPEPELGRVVAVLGAEAAIAAERTSPAIDGPARGATG